MMQFRFPVVALIAMSLSLLSQAQSLGEVAREVRAEKQRSTAPRAATVITNDDISSPSTQEAEAKAEAPVKNGESNPSSETAKKESKPDKKSDETVKDAAKERADQELSREQRDQEINKGYIDRILQIREQIKAAELQMQKLTMHQIESTNLYRLSGETSLTVQNYETQQREFNSQIASQKNLIASLHAQLEDAQEAARHAGVPHALDY